MTDKGKYFRLFVTKRKDSYEKHNVCSNGMVNAWSINQFRCLKDKGVCWIDTLPFLLYIILITERII